jgi:hypothetical protein
VLLASLARAQGVRDLTWFLDRTADLDGLPVLEDGATRPPRRSTRDVTHPPGWSSR